jgi:hypothetical protein
MGIVSQRNAGAGQEVILTKQLFGIKTLKSLVVNSTDGVAVREHGVAVTIRIYAEYSGFADTTLSQQQSAARNFGIFFLATKASQERHELKARSVW